MKSRIMILLAAFLFVSAMFGFGCKGAGEKAPSLTPSAEEGSEGGLLLPQIEQPAGPQATSPVCGDGVVDTGEECDDGNTVAGDGCDTNCMVEPVCGNSMIEAGEECDDGNTVAGDGCAADCVMESPDTFVFQNIVLKNPNGDEQEWESKTISPRASFLIEHAGLLPADSVSIKLGTSAVDIIKETVPGGTLIKTKYRMHNSMEYTLSVGTETHSYKIVSAGDINGDGYGDFVVGAPEKIKGGLFSPEVGAADIFMGRESYDYPQNAATAAHVRIRGDVANMKFGFSTALGDVNGDGLYDVVIGAPREGNGCVYIFLGSDDISGGKVAKAGGNQDARICLTSGSPVDFGRAIALGDFNADGFDDLIIGAHMGPYGFEQAGTVYGFMGSSDGIASKDVDKFSYADFVRGGFGKYQHTGYSLAAGDVNGDGYDDVIAGAVGNNLVSGYGCVAGRVYIWTGFEGGVIDYNSAKMASAEPSPTCIADKTDRFGSSLAIKNDLSRAQGGADHVIIGSKGNVFEYIMGQATMAYSTNPWTQMLVAGWAGQTIVGIPELNRILFMDSGSLQFIFSPSEDISLGNAIAAADPNGDGVPDYIVGAKNYHSGWGAIWLNLKHSNQDQMIKDFGNFGTSIAGGLVR